MPSIYDEYIAGIQNMHMEKIKQKMVKIAMLDKRNMALNLFTKSKTSIELQQSLIIQDRDTEQVKELKAFILAKLEHEKIRIVRYNRAKRIL